MNVIILTGNVTKEPEVRMVGERKVARFSLAVNRVMKKNDHPVTDFFDCDAWGTQADFVEKHVHKGSSIGVTGRLEFDSYEKDGAKRKLTKVMVDRIEFNGKRNDNGEGSATPAAQPAKAAPASAPTASEDPF